MQEFGTPPAELMESVGVSVDEAGRPTMLPSSASPSDALSNCALSYPPPPSPPKMNEKSKDPQSDK